MSHICPNAKLCVAPSSFAKPRFTASLTSIIMSLYQNHKVSVRTYFFLPALYFQSD